MKKLLWLASLAGFLLAGCSSIPTPSEKYAHYSAESIYQTAEKKLATKHYKDAVQAYEALDTLYPFNDHAQQAQLAMIYAYYETDDMPATAASAERYIQLYPRDQHVDYAYYLRGLANFNQDRGFFQRYLPVDASTHDPGTMKESYQDFSTLIKLFPNSAYAPDAKQHLIYLRAMFAKKEEAIALYYYEKAAYEAAINRANEVLLKYADTPAAKDALVLLYNAYHQLGLAQSAGQVEQILKLNYPGASYVVHNEYAP